MLEKWNNRQPGNQEKIPSPPGWDMKAGKWENSAR
jgi:hypothetical protein